MFLFVHDEIHWKNEKHDYFHQFNISVSRVFKSFQKKKKQHKAQEGKHSKHAEKQKLI